MDLLREKDQPTRASLTELPDRTGGLVELRGLSKGCGTKGPEQLLRGVLTSNRKRREGKGQRRDPSKGVQVNHKRRGGEKLGKGNLLEEKRSLFAEKWDCKNRGG